MNNKKILIAEDEGIIALALKLSLESAGFNVIGIVKTGEKAVQVTKELCPDILIMDIFLKDDMDGIEAAKLIKEIKNISIIYLTGNIHMKTEERLTETNPVAILNKPCDRTELINILETL